jgi:hypothetical protein
MSSNTALDFNAPDGIEPIVGWRIWMVGADRERMGYQSREVSLHSPFNGVPWHPGRRFEASCNNPSRRIRQHGVGPEARCSCGVYALKEIESLLWWVDFLPLNSVLGEVSLWGKVVVHKHGYRAQYGYPRRLWVATGTSESLKSALKVYGVPVATAEDPEIRPLIEPRLSILPAQKAAVAFLEGGDWSPPSCCPVCKHLIPFAGVCFHCDPEGANRELERFCEEMEYEISEERRQRFPWLYAPTRWFAWLYAPTHSIDIPPRLNSEVDKAKLRAFAMAGALTAALATLLTHPPQGL